MNERLGSCVCCAPCLWMPEDLRRGRPNAARTGTLRWMDLLPRATGEAGRLTSAGRPNRGGDLAIDKGQTHVLESIFLRIAGQICQICQISVPRAGSIHSSFFL